MTHNPARMLRIFHRTFGRIMYDKWRARVVQAGGRRPAAWDKLSVARQTAWVDLRKDYADEDTDTDTDTEGC